MSDDDVNQLTPDDGDLDEAVVARLRSALLNDVVVNDTERDHTIASVLAALDNDSQAPLVNICLLYTSPSPRDKRQSRMPSSA